MISGKLVTGASVDHQEYRGVHVSGSAYAMLGRYWPMVTLRNERMAATLGPIHGIDGFDTAVEALEFAMQYGLDLLHGEIDGVAPRSLWIR